ncbi:MAG: GNAT family N-acetyltransferase [Planctomycetota bacterium]
MSCRAAKPTDRDAIETITRSIGLFEAEEVAAVMEGFDQRSGDARWWVWDEVGRGVVGVAYVEPERMADRVWNLLYIAVHPASHRQGLGTELLKAVRGSLSEGRQWIVETAAVPEFANVRRWYVKQGFTRVAEIPDYYADGVGKTVFVQRLQPKHEEA